MVKIIGRSLTWQFFNFENQRKLTNFMTHVLINATSYFWYQSLIVSGQCDISMHLLLWSRDYFFRLWSLFMLDFFMMSHLFGPLTPPVVYLKGQNFQVKYFRRQTLYNTHHSWPMTHGSPSKSKISISKNFKIQKKIYLATLNTCFQYYLHVTVNQQW